MKILYVCFVLFFSGSTLFSSTWRVSMIAEALRLCPKNVVTKSFVVTFEEITLDWCMASLPHIFQVVGRFQLKLDVCIEECVPSPFPPPFHRSLNHNYFLQKNLITPPPNLLLLFCNANFFSSFIFKKTTKQKLCSYCCKGATICTSHEIQCFQ